MACWLVLLVNISVLNLVKEGEGGNVRVNAADLVGSATAVAVTVAMALLATPAGASYSTDVLACLLRAPGPVRFQATPFSEQSFKIVTVIMTD